MATISDDVRAVIEKSEWAAIATRGRDGPHLAGTLRGRGEIQTSGPFPDAVRERFAWARGALVVRVEEAATQL